LDSASFALAVALAVALVVVLVVVHVVRICYLASTVGEEGYCTVPLHLPVQDPVHCHPGRAESWRRSEHCRVAHLET